MTRDLNWLASVRARLGFLPSNNLLIYGTGGVAWGGVHYTSSLQSVGPGTTWAVDSRTTEVGFVVGGGAEWKITQNWLLRGEYLFYRLGGETVVANGVPNNFPGFQIGYNWNRFDAHVARVGVSYQFN